jgi:hypothetical protein
MGFVAKQRAEKAEKAHDRNMALSLGLDALDLRTRGRLLKFAKTRFAGVRCRVDPCGAGSSTMPPSTSSSTCGEGASADRVGRWRDTSTPMHGASTPSLEPWHGNV